MKLPYEETARVAESMAQMLRAGVPTERMFEVLLRHHRSSRVREAIEEIRRHVRAGRTFYEGFAARPKVWPRYFVELVRCSERAGLLYAGFEEGADHLRKMARVRRAAHRLWLNPTCIILFGWAVRGLLIAIFLGAGAGLAFAANCVQFAAPIAMAIVSYLYVPAIRKVMDRVLLHLPLIGEMVRDLCLYQFAKCFQYLYMGGVSAPDIVRLAAGAMSNRYLAERVGAAADEVQRKGVTFAEALRNKMPWPDGYIQHLSQGELSGQLQTTLEALANERKEALETRVEAARRVIEPIVAYATIFAIAMTVLGIAMALRGGLFGG